MKHNTEINKLTKNKSIKNAIWKIYNVKNNIFEKTKSEKTAIVSLSTFY